ncbi:hypothetical protein BSKO_02245 [Bryopsis sp. KO-2023]|nr:hypothetical protein BSKO_02245 [Bryopsis sp. KO-2023]
MPFPEKGMQKVELDGNLCIGSCDVDLYLAVPQQKADFVKGVPFSLHRGPSMPQQFKERKSFTIANETVPFTLNITAGISSSDGSEATPLPGIGPENPAIEEPVALTPGENVTISFHVRRCPGDPSDPQTIACPALEEALSSELLVMVVNKAYLELMDNPLVDLAKELMTKIRTDMSSRTFPESDSWMDPNAYAEARDLFLERIKKDPWLARRMVDYSGNVRRYLNRPDEYFSKEDVQDGTIGPLYNSQFEQLWEALGRIPHKNRLPLTGPSSRSPTEASGSSDQTVEPKLRLKENFKVTPIFKTIRVDPDTGYGTVDFTAPDSLGTFSVRAYASSDLAQRGSFESEIVVRLPLSLTSSAPRFVRIGDEFEAGVVVTINKKDKEGVPVVVTLLSDPEKARNIEYQPGDGSPQFLKNCEDPSDLSCLVELDKKQIKTDVDGQVEVRFKFKAARLGVADLTIRADIAGASDALKVLIPVHGQQKQVQIATSFALKGKLEKPTPSIRNVTTPLPVEMKTYYSSQPAPPPATSAVVVNHAPNPQFGGGALKNKHGEEELGGDMLSQPPPVASIAFVKKGVVLDGRTSEGSLDSGTGSADAGVMDAMKNAANSKKSANFGRKLRQSVGVRLTTASDFGKKNPPVGDAAVSKREKLSVNAESDGDKVNAYQKIVDSESITTKAPVMWTSSDTTSDQVSTDTPLGGQIGFVKKIDTLSSGGHRDYKTGAVEPIQKHKQPAESTQKVGNEPDASPLLRIPGSPSATPPLQKPMSAPDSGGSPVTNSGGTTERGFKKIKKVALGLYGVHGKSSKNRRKGWVDVLHQSIENVEWDEGLKFPDAEPGSGFLGLLAGVGRFPSVLHGVRTTITNWSPLRDWISVYDALANITTPFVLQQYDTEDPKAADHPTYVKAVHAFNISMKNLDALTTEDCGLKSSDYDLGCEETRDINFYSNSWGTWIAANVLEKTKTASNESLKEGVEKLKTLSKLWQKKLVEKVKDIAMWDWNKYGAHLGVYYAVEIRFDLGVDWAPPDDFPEHIKSDLSMDRLSESLQKDELSMEARAKVALAWLKKLGKVEGSKHADVVDSVTAFRNSIRTIGRTAYIARSPQTAAPLDHKTQALILLVFIRSGESGPLIEKLANFVATPSRWYNSEATIFGNLALTAYDEAAGSTEPDLDLTAKSGDITLLQGSFTSPSDPMLSNSTSFDSLSDPPEPLMFKVEGKGEATIVATLDFTPAQLLPFPSYRGIYVERIIQISGADGNPTGPPLKAVPLGKPVVFSIQVTSPDQLGSVSLTVMMPGGIEPIDPLVEKDAQMTCDVGRLGIEISWWRWNLCPAQCNCEAGFTGENCGELQDG